jgi:UDP-N-acetylmuramoyl-L-alanyl-D-glutamate--2,6-diaminopimelate ligase
LYLSALNKIGAGMPDPVITGLTQDSRQVQPGFLFAALSGVRDAGAHYLKDAVENGAVAVLVSNDDALPDGLSNVAVIRSDNPRRDLSLMAAAFYHHQPAHIVAVTGTNGKTSTVHFAQQMWRTHGVQAASLGTLGVRGATGTQAGSMTTPDPVSLHTKLADLSETGITHLAMEASSHGLQQHRLDGVKIAAAGFTNLTRDHLDYHVTMEGYLAAKARLFSDLLQDDGVAVLNSDVGEFFVLQKLCNDRNIRVWGYGAHGPDIKIIKRTALPEGQALSLDVFGKRHEVVLPLVGSFQAMNALCALGLALAVEPNIDVGAALSNLQGAPGRLQRVSGHPSGAAVYVDYAHTPDALENILHALRPHTQGRLLCLFGCGGDRDPGKRSMMGGIAANLADLAIITDDNPRSENPATIRAAIAAGAGDDAKIIDDRRKAIQWAIEELKTGDVLVLAGKGHEQGQIFADRTDPFDDVEEAKQAIERLIGKKN